MCSIGIPKSNVKNRTENHTNIVVHYCYCKRWTIRTPGGCGYFAPIDDLLTVRSDSNICVVFCHHEEQGKGPKWPERKLSHTMHWLNVSIKAKIIALDVSSSKYWYRCMHSIITFVQYESYTSEVESDRRLKYIHCKSICPRIYCCPRYRH